jgi:predicted hydrocarbon binding protein
MGLAAGERLKEKLSTYDFKSAASLFEEREKQSGVMGTYQISDRLYHATTQCGYSCGVGLKDAGRPICEAVMSINQGQFKSICGCDVEMNIVRSRATGADCCEVIYRPIDVSDG